MKKHTTVWAVCDSESKSICSNCDTNALLIFTTRAEANEARANIVNNEGLRVVKASIRTA